MLSYSVFDEYTQRGILLNATMLLLAELSRSQNYADTACTRMLWIHLGSLESTKEAYGFLDEIQWNPAITKCHGTEKICSL